MNELIEDYERNRLFIEVLSVAIERWGDQAKEFSEFNKNISNSNDGEALYIKKRYPNFKMVPKIGHSRHCAVIITRLYVTL